MNFIKFLTLVLVIFTIIDLDSLVDGKRKKKKGSKKKKSNKITNTVFPVKPEGPTDIKKPKVTLPITQKETLEYIPPKILARLKGVNDVASFIKEFKPAGVETEGEVLKYITDGKTVQMDIKDEQDVNCKPRMKIEKIPPRAGYFTWPICEKVNRCGGCCGGPNRICEMVAYKNVTKTVLRLSYSTGIATPDQTQSVHHTKCACNCRIKERDCLPSQTFDAENCQCICKTKQRVCGPKHFWSNKICGCKCALLPVNCSSWKKEWSDQECGCVCIKKPEACATRNKTLDRNTCKCV